MMAQQPFFQGHRGCRGWLPENSIPAFQKALDLGVVLEMDVCISKDGQVVVSHEPYMNALFCTKPDGTPVTKEEEKQLNLFEMNYAEIKQFDSGKRGNVNFPKQEKRATYKPLLSEVLTLAESYRKKSGKPVYYNIEIKSDSSEYGISQPKTVAIFSDLVYREIMLKVPAEFITLQSFDFAVLKYWNASMRSGKFKKVALSALVTRKSPENVIKELGFVPDIYSSFFQSLTKEQVEKCHNLQMKVIPWTVNEAKDIEQVTAMGVDGIITDYPTQSSKPLK